MSIRTHGVYTPRWFVGRAAASEIKKLFRGRTLVFPSGEFPYGDVKADIHKPLYPDVVADLLDKNSWPWKTGEFDTVFSDPPFSFYTDNNIGWKWYYNLSRLASKRIIFKTPKIRVKLKSAIWKKHYVIIEDNNGYSFQFLQVFDRINKMLESKR